MTRAIRFKKLIDLLHGESAIVWIVLGQRRMGKIIKIIKTATKGHSGVPRAEPICEVPVVLNSSRKRTFQRKVVLAMSTGRQQERVEQEVTERARRRKHNHYRKAFSSTLVQRAEHNGQREGKRSRTHWEFSSETASAFPEGGNTRNSYASQHSHVPFPRRTGRTNGLPADTMYHGQGSGGTWKPI